MGYFPTTAGISTTISPREIMTGETLNYKRNLEIPFPNVSTYMKKRPIAKSQDLAPGVIFAWVPAETIRVGLNL